MPGTEVSSLLVYILYLGVSIIFPFGLRISTFSKWLASEDESDSAKVGIADVFKVLIIATVTPGYRVVAWLKICL